MGVLGVGVSGAPKLPTMLAGSLLLGASTISLGFVSTLLHLYLCCALMGLGVGSVYSVAISTSVALFPPHRGLVAGLTAGCYGAGSVLTIATIEASIREHGGPFTLRVLGASLGAACLLSRALLPSSAVNVSAARERTALLGREMTLVQAVREPSYWLLYVMLILITWVGLVVSAQLKPIADSLQVPREMLVAALQV